jgi:DNA-directed RNA polymerase specialized sigma subunit
MKGYKLKERQNPKRKTVSIDSMEGFGIEETESDHNNWSRRVDEKNPLNDQGFNDPLNILTKRESIKLLREVIEKELTEREQLIIARIMNGDKQVEIAKDLNTNKQYISNTYLKAIQKIRNGFSSLGVVSKGF